MPDEEYQELHKLAKDNAKKINEIHDALVGRIDGKEGILPRLKNVEDAQNTRRKLEWAGLVALAGLIAKAVWELVIKSGGAQ